MLRHIVQHTRLRQSILYSSSSLWNQVVPRYAPRRGLPPTMIRSMNTRKDNDRNSSGNDKDLWDAWIPPPHPLAGDRGQSHEYAQDDDLVLAEDDSDAVEDTTSTTDGAAAAEASPPPPVDWLQTRRQQLASLDAPKETHIPVLEHTLLTKDEVIASLEYFGARDIVVIVDSPALKRMGGPMGLILATIDNATQRWRAAETLCRHLKARKLEERDVVGAELGPEGSAEDSWVVVDARNYVIHLQEEQTRRALNLEKLWSGHDGLYDLDLNDEDAVDRYVEENPVPDAYTFPKFDWTDRIKSLQRARFTATRKTSTRRKPLSRRRR
jgi:ribosomal silencing factor RsfS